MGLISQLSIGTMGMLRLPPPFPWPSVSLGCGTMRLTLFLNTNRVGKHTPSARVFWKGEPVYLCSHGGGRLSQVPAETSCVSTKHHDPGRLPSARLFIALAVLFPQTRLRKLPHCPFLSRLFVRFLHSLRTLRASLSLNYATLGSGCRLNSTG